MNRSMATVLISAALAVSLPAGAHTEEYFDSINAPHGGQMRMARAGMIEALDAEYTRTAILKGLSYPKVIWRHVLRNALLPTISVIATQTVYLIGGLVVIEILFHYQGIGSLIFTAANKKDFPMLQAGVMVVGALFAVATLIADLLYASLNPRIRLEGRE